MADEEKDGSLLRVKADASGVDLAISRGVPSLLSRLLPTRVRLRRSVDHAVVDRIVAKVSRGQALDDAEAAFAEEMLSEQAQKFVRLAKVQERAQQLIEAAPVGLLEASPSPASEGTPATPSDWINKFREDASLVDDDTIREIYARVLCEEGQRPGAFALRTLGVLRYMDREVADAFGRLQKVLIDGSVVPQQAPNEDHILRKANLDHTTMLMLNDAGLVNAATNSERTYKGHRSFIVCSGYNRVLSVRRPDDSEFTFKLHIHVVTPAGIQLARIAEIEPDEAAFGRLVSWVRSQVPGVEIAIADLPSRTWSGPAESLVWRVLEEAAQLAP